MDYKNSTNREGSASVVVGLTSRESKKCTSKTKPKSCVCQYAM